jgi:putative transposase
MTDAIFSAPLDLAIQHFGVGVLKDAGARSKAKAFCERLDGTTRLECLDYMIPINERHLRTILKEFVR